MAEQDPTFGGADPLFEAVNKAYRNNPNSFSQEDVNFLRSRAQDLGVDFEEQSTDFDLMRIASKAITGFVTGFSTIDGLGDTPRNEWEQLSYNIGHLAGFMGFVPGAGTAARMATMGLSRGAAHFLGMEAEKAVISSGEKFLAGAASRSWSVPMLASDWFMKGVGSYVSKNAAIESISFLQNSIVKDIIGGAAHLGVASAVSAAPIYQAALDKRIDGLVGGIEAGAVFKVIGNTITAGNLAKATGGKIGFTAQDIVENPDEYKTALMWQTGVRAVAASMYMGLPSTLHNEPGLMQAYQYISGAAFGMKEQSIHEKEAGRFITNFYRNRTDYELYNVLSDKPEKMTDYDQLTDEAKELVKASVSFSHGRLFMKDHVAKYVDYYDQQISEGGIVTAKALQNALDMIRDDVKSGKIDDPKKAAQAAFALEWVDKQQTLEANGVSPEQAFAQTAGHVSKEGSQAFKVINELKKYAITSQLAGDAMNATDAIVSNEVRLQINDHIRETGADPRFINVFLETARGFQQKGDADKMVSNGEFQRRVLFDLLGMSVEPPMKPGALDDMKTKIEALDKKYEEDKTKVTTPQELEDLQKIYESDKQLVMIDYLDETRDHQSPDEFIKKVESKYGTIGDEQKKKLIKFWINVHDATVQPQMTPNQFGKLRKTDELNAEGERNIQLRPMSFVEDILTNTSGYRTRVTMINEAYDQGRAGRKSNSIKPLFGVDGAVDVNIHDKSILPGIFLSAYDKDMMVVSGMKANSTIVLMKSLVKETGSRVSEEGGMDTVYSTEGGADFTVQEKLRALQDHIDEQNRIIDEKNKTLPKDKQIEYVRGAFDVYTSALEEYIDSFRNSKDKKWEKVDDDTLVKMFEKNYANNIAYIELINSDGIDAKTAMPWEYIVSNPKKFITTPQEFNKRAQLLYAGEHRLRGELFHDLQNIVMDPNRPDLGPQLNYVLIDHRGLSINANGISELPWAYEMHGDKIVRQQRAVDDGALTLRSDVYDRMLETMGLQSKTSHQKGVGLYAGSDMNGALMFKFAYHRASEELDKYMMEQGIHALVPLKVAKQTGDREARNLSYTDKGYELSGGQVYNLPVNKLTINYSAGETEHNIHDQRAVVQLYSNLNLQQADHSTMMEFKNFLKKLGFDGDDVHNALAKQHAKMYQDYADALYSGGKMDESALATMRKQMDKLSDDIDVTKLGFSQVLNIVRGNIRVESKLYDKMMQHILRLDADGEFNAADEGVVDKDTENINNAVDTMRMGAMRILQTVGKVTPAMVEVGPLKSYVDSVTTSYLNMLIKRPSIPYSMKAVLSPMYLDQIAKYNLQAGEYMMDKGAKNKRIRFTTSNNVKEEVGFGKAWEIYNATTDPVLKSQMERDLLHAVVRVPADSVSGVRMLKFKGFTDIEGYGMIMHPEDMVNEGGADYDIDSAFVYTYLPESVKDTYLKNADEWYKWYAHDGNDFIKTKEGKYIEVKKDAPGAKKVYAPAKASNPFSAVEDPNIVSMKKHPVATPSPTMIVRVAQDTHLSNMALGPGLNHTRRLRTLFDIYGANAEVPLNFWGDAIKPYEELIGKYLPEGAVIQTKGMKAFVRTADSSQGLRDMTREIVNVAADAEGKLKSNREIANIITNSFLGSDKNIHIRVPYRVGEGKKEYADVKIPYADFVSADPERNVSSLFKYYSKLSALDNAFKGYDYGGSRKLKDGTIEYTQPHRMDISEMLDKMNIAVNSLDHHGDENILYSLSKDVVTDPEVKRFIDQGGLDGENAKIFGARWVGVQTKRKMEPGIKQEFDAFMKSHDPLAQLIMRYSFRNYLQIATPNATKPWQKFQDAMDVVSALRMKAVGEAAEKAGYDMKELESIVVKLDGYKKYFRVMQKMDAMEDMSEAEKYMSRSLTKQELYKEVSEYFKTLYGKSKELGDFAAQWYTGSLYAQTEDMRSYMDEYEDRFAKLKAQFDDPTTKKEDKAELKKKLDDARQDIADKRKQYSQTNFGMLAANSPFIPDYILRDHWNTYSEFVGATFKDHVGPDDMKDIVMRSMRGPSPQMLNLQPDAVAFGQTAFIDELVDAGEVMRRRTSYFKALPQIAQMELNKRLTNLSNALRDMLYRHPNLIPHFNEKIFGHIAVRLGELGVEPNLVKLETIEQALKDYHDTFDEKGDPRLRWYHYFMPPQVLDDKMRRWDPQEFVYKAWPTVTGIDEKTAVVRDSYIRVFMSTQEKIRLFSNAMAKSISEAQSWVDRHFTDQFHVYMDLKEDAYDMMNYVTSLRERDRGRQTAEGSAFYEEEYQRAYKRITDRGLMQKTWMITDFGETGKAPGLKPMGFNEVVERLKAASEGEAKLARKMWIYNESFDSFMKKVNTVNPQFTDEEKEIARWVKVTKHGFIDEEATLSRILEGHIGGLRVPMLSQEFLQRLRWQESLRKVSYHDENDKETNVMRSAKNKEEMYDMMQTLLDSDMNERGHLDYKSLKDVEIRSSEYHPHVDHTSAEKKKAIARYIGKLRTMGFGEKELQIAEVEIKNHVDKISSSDGKIAEESEDIFAPQLITPEQWNSTGLNYTPSALRARSPLGPMGGYDKSPFAWIRYHSDMYRGYFQGIQAFVSEHLIRGFENNAPMGKETPNWAKFMRQYRRDNLGLSSLYPKEFLEDKTFDLQNNAYYYFTDQAMFGFLKKLESKFGFSFIPGKESEWKQYADLIHSNGGLGRIMSGKAEIMRDMKTYKEMGKIGNNISIMTNDPQGKKPKAVLISKGAAGSNQRKAYAYAQKHDIPAISREEFDANMNEIKKTPASDVDENALAEARRVSMFLSKLSVMEGKFELTSLLSNTKSMMGNMTTGGINTAIYTGLQPFRDAASLESLRRIMPWIKSWDDVNKFRERYGALESYTKETIEEPVLRSENFKRFVNEAMQVMQKDPSVPDATIADLAKKYKLGDSVVKSAAAFMRKSETAIRGHSWMAHYLQARKVLEANNYTFTTDSHPWLIEMANRGTAASQFLYNNANKPAFARTNLGRIFFRFQQWAWQSVLMRKGILEQAGMTGFTPGTQQYERYARMVTADLFVLGLATLFPASIFQQNMAPPMSVLVQISDYFFGDKKQKEQSFFGSLPYPANIMNPLLPPITRIPGAVFGSMVSGDWDRFLSYQMYTWFPFGRFVRDVKKTVDSPAMIIENFSNIPVHEIGRISRKEQNQISNPQQLFHSYLRDAFRLADTNTH